MELFIPYFLNFGVNPGRNPHLHHPIESHQQLGVVEVPQLCPVGSEVLRDALQAFALGKRELLGNVGMCCSLKHPTSQKKGFSGKIAFTLSKVDLSRAGQFPGCKLNEK